MYYKNAHFLIQNSHATRPLTSARYHIPCGQHLAAKLSSIVGRRLLQVPACQQGPQLPYLPHCRELNLATMCPMLSFSATIIISPRHCLDLVMTSTTTLVVFWVAPSTHVVAHARKRMKCPLLLWVVFEATRAVVASASEGK